MTLEHLPSDIEMSDFDNEIIEVEARPARKTANAQPQSNLLWGDMQQTETASGKIVVKPKITPSPYMQAILDRLAVPGPNLVIKATAGSGKTTLLEMISEQMIRLGLLQEDRAAFLAYNRHIVKELQERLPVEFDIRTINSLGHLIVQEHCPKIPFKPGKYEQLIKEAVANRKLPAAVRAELRERVMTALTLSMNNLLEPGVDFESWRGLMLDYDLPVREDDRDLYGLTFEVLRRGMELLRPAGERDSEDTTEWVMSYLDQIYAPFYYKWRLEYAFKYLLIDEAQDLSLAQMNLLVSATNEESRIIAVGDASQAIYSFQGSLATSIDDLAFYIQAEFMPLSVTYRCPRRHVALAAEYTDRIESAPNASEGELGDITSEDVLRMARSGHMILCRTNAPLIRWCFMLARRGTKSHIRGVDIGQSLVKLVKEVITWDEGAPHVENYSDDLILHHEELIEKMRAHLGAQYRTIKEEAAKSGKKPEMRLALADDKMLSLKAAYEEHKPATAGELIAQIRALFSEKNEGVTLSTVHKAKGLEADTVYIIEPDLMPHPRAESEQALLAEKAVKFVALTRAKKALYFVDAGEPVVPEHLRTLEPPHDA